MSKQIETRRLPRVKREEDYLKAMYLLIKEKNVIRVKDLAKMLGVKPPSVVDYLDRLAEKGLVRYEKHEVILLTDKGKKIAETVYNRHKAIKELLIKLFRVPEDIAEKDACYMEHGISELTLERIYDFIEFLKNCPKGLPKFLKHIDHYYRKKEYPEECFKE